MANRTPAAGNCSLERVCFDGDRFIFNSSKKPLSGHFHRSCQIDVMHSAFRCGRGVGGGGPNGGWGGGGGEAGGWTRKGKAGGGGGGGVDGGYVGVGGDSRTLEFELF